jgi:hypothetical protein
MRTRMLLEEGSWGVNTVSGKKPAPCLLPMEEAEEEE